MKSHKSDSTTITVLGGGSWGTALVKILTDNGLHVFWYIRDSLVISHIQEKKTNPNYLSSIRLNNAQITLSQNIKWTVAQSDHLLLAIPAAFIGPILESIKDQLQEKSILSAVKGIVPSSQLGVGEHLEKQLNVPKNNIGVIGGPSHAEEVAHKQLSYLTVAFPEKKKAEIWAKRLACHYIRTKASNDTIGIEYAAMLKNIYALAAGIASGLGYGDNFNSVLICQAVREMKRFIRTIYGKKRNINHAAYLGDLLVTAFSQHSRNRKFGEWIGKGYSVAATQMKLKMVAEGYYAVASAVQLNNNRTDVAIIDAVYAILYLAQDPKETFEKLAEEIS